MRMARWALAKQYGKDIAYTGPIYSGYIVKDDRVIVSFEKDSLFGGLMIGNKGMAKDYREAGKYVEPARPTPDDRLNHFRLCGNDKVWHAAEAVISGETVVVTSEHVSEPIGVQYAYSAVPENSNLYNKAGLPATPFAAINGKFIFEEDDLEKAAALKAKYAQYTDPDYPILQVVEYFRDGAIIQRDKPIVIWGWANPGGKVSVQFGKEKAEATADAEKGRWEVAFPAEPANAVGRKLIVASGDEKEVFCLLKERQFLGHVDHRGLDPAIHQVDRVQPFPGDLGGWKPPVVDQGVDLLFVDTQVLSHGLGVQKWLVHGGILLPAGGGGKKKLTKYY